MTGRITNIVVEKGLFRAYLTLEDGNVETRLFPVEATVEDISGWKNERIQFYNELEIKAEELRNNLIEE